MSDYLYKTDAYEDRIVSNDYFVKYKPEEYPRAFAKIRGNKEFETDLTKNNTGYDVYLTGRDATKEEYESA